MFCYPGAVCLCELENFQTELTGSSYLSSWGTRAQKAFLSLSMMHWFPLATSCCLSLMLFVAVVSAQYNSSTTPSSSNMSLECSADQEKLSSTCSLSMHVWCRRLGSLRAPARSSRASTPCSAYSDKLLHRMLTLNIEKKTILYFFQGQMCAICKNIFSTSVSSRCLQGNRITV